MNKWMKIYVILIVVFLTGASLFRTAVFPLTGVQPFPTNGGDGQRAVIAKTDIKVTEREEIDSSMLLLNATKPPKPEYPRAHNLTKQATIIVQLSGEMANNLHHIAHGLGLQLWAKEEFNIDCNLVFRHHEGPNNRAPKPKWKSARDNIQKCFPKLSSWQFGEGNKKEFSRRQNLQRVWLEGKMDHLFGMINSADPRDIQRGLGFLATDILTDADRPYVEEDSHLRLPYLFSESLDAFPMIDRYYDEIRELFEFNNSLCCAKLPHPSDSIFHFRNYQSEMPERRAYDMGFAELSSTKVSKELFGHLQPQTGDQSRNTTVQITTRIYNQKARNYAEALEERGIHATLITGQSAVEDFCFLKQAQQELAGSARSTFVLWAALLGNASVVKLYHVDTFGLRQRHPDFWDRFTYNFTNPHLHRIQFALYRAEEMDPK